MFAHWFNENPLEATVLGGLFAAAGVALVIWILGGFKPEPRMIPKRILYPNKPAMLVIEWVKTRQGEYAVKTSSGATFWFPATGRDGNYTLVFEQEA